MFIQTLKSKYSDGAQLDHSNPSDLNEILKKYAFQSDEPLKQSESVI